MFDIDGFGDVYQQRLFFEKRNDKLMARIMSAVRVDTSAPSG